MLTTLFKHEMRATAKIFLWVYVAFVVVAVVNALTAPNMFGGVLTSGYASAQAYSQSVLVFPELLRGLTMTIYTMAIIAMSIITIVIIILRFYKNLLGDEGYLMFTLPVTREQHLLSKFLAAMVWSICTGVLILLSVLMMFGTLGGFEQFVRAIDDMIAAGVPVGRYTFIFIVILIIGSASGILMLYAAMAWGPNLIKNRVGGSILAFIIIYIASQVLFVIIISIMSVTVGSNLIADMFIANYDTAVNNTLAIFDTIFATVIIYSAIISIACWMLTRFLVNKKLNLA